MKAVVYSGPGQRSLEDIDDPTIIDATDAIVAIDTATICGTDLHILKGDVPAVKPGTVLGHEGVGRVVAVGSAVRSVQPGDRVLMSCISGCGYCVFCRKAQYGQCRNGGGWILGHLINGLQAEYARIPFADNALHAVPDSLSDEQLIYLSDILPTSYEVGVINGGIRPGDTVAVVGAGPIGLAAIMTAKLFSPSRIIAVEPSKSRRKYAEQFGADMCVVPEDAAEVTSVATNGLGADVVLEAVGTPETFELCAELVRPGGHLANIGVHGKPATLHLESLWIRNVTITTGLVDTSSTPTLLRLVAAGQLDPTVFTTHRFALSDAMEAYDTFGAAADTGALKVLMHR
jgi:alcohol dehydrogenase